jgi:hypothetical protein
MFKEISASGWLFDRNCFYKLFNFSHVGRLKSFAEENYHTNPLKTKTNTFSLKTQYVPRSKHSYSRFKNQLVNAVYGKIGCLI